MLKLLIAGIAALALSGLAQGSTPTPTVTAEYDFLVNKVEGKKFVSPTQEVTIEAGRLVAENTTRRTIRNVVAKNARLTFELVTEQEQINYFLDEHGNRILPGRRVNGTSFRHCAFSKLKSAPGMFGVCYSMMEHPAETRGQLVFDQGVLTISERTAAPFTDAYAATELGFKPAVLTFEMVISERNGGMIIKTKEQGYDYDVETQTEATEPYAEIVREYKPEN
jgi:hypothetical protein